MDFLEMMHADAMLRPSSNIPASVHRSRRLHAVIHDRPNAPWTSGIQGPAFRPPCRPLSNLSFVRRSSSDSCVMTACRLQVLNAPEGDVQKNNASCMSEIVDIHCCCASVEVHFTNSTGMKER